MPPMVTSPFNFCVNGLAFSTSDGGGGKRGAPEFHAFFILVATGQNNRPMCRIKASGGAGPFICSFHAAILSNVEIDDNSGESPEMQSNLPRR